MSAVEHISFSDQDFRAEIQDLRKRLLPIFFLLLPAGLWIWYYSAIITGQDTVNHLAPVALLSMLVFIIWRVRDRRYRLACWLLILGLIFVDSLLILSRVTPFAPAFGLVIIIIANALLSPTEALAAATLALIVTITTQARGIPRDVFIPPFVDSIILYYLTWMALWLSSRPLRSSVESALAGWSEARKALLEVRQRRAELYRVVRALEEATSRIERVNNELVVAQHEAEIARAIKSRLAVTVSHELRGPLNLILGFSKLMALSPENYGEPLPKAYRADTLTIYRNSQHLLALIDDILDLSKIEAKRLPLVKDRVDLQEDVINKVVTSVGPLAERKGLYLHQETTGDLPPILADAVRLRQALLNLLTNAIRFTANGGITVQACKENEYISLSVHDTGPGIAEEEMPRLFKEFYQLHTSPSPEGESSSGSGLGLSISKHLIELHGGQIWAESKRGTGTTIYFTLPLPNAGAVISDQIATATTVEQRSNPTCLIVHEDPRIVKLIARYIEGYHIIGVPQGDNLVPLIEKLHPRAIIADPSLQSNIQAQLATTPFDVPTIHCIMPRLGREQTFHNLLRYLIKPVGPEALMEAMHQVERNGETTVLLVDDDPDAVRLLERMLTSIPRPYRILKAYDGLQAWEIMQEVVPDIVFLDLVIPQLDGEQVIERMQAEERTRNIPLVIVSARDWLEDNATLGTPLSAQMKRPMNIGQGARCIQVLLDNLAPRYVSHQASAG